MKSLNDLKDELSIQFGSILDNLSDNELNTIVAFLLTSFAYDFPEVHALAVKDSRRLYLHDLHEELQEIRMVVPIRTIDRFLNGNIQNSINGHIDNTWYSDYPFSTAGYPYSDDHIVKLDELFAIQLSSQYIESMSSYYTPKKPLIHADSTGEFVDVSASIISFLTERIVDPYSIKEYVYGVLRPYAYYRMIDFIINRQFANLMDLNQKAFDMIYDNISKDLTGGDYDQITSVSLSGLSVSFGNKITQYGGMLGGLAGAFNNPNYTAELNKMRDRQYNKFKRKKNVFYNYLY